MSSTMSAGTDGEVRVTPWQLSDSFKEYGLDGYRIWNKKTPHGMFQRHEWQRTAGGTDMDDWIPSCPDWAFGAEPISEARSLSPTGEE